MIRGIDFKGIIKRLAKECLDKKWVTIRFYEKYEDVPEPDINYSDECAFCYDAEKRLKLSFAKGIDYKGMANFECEHCLCPNILCGYSVNCAEYEDSEFMIECLQYLVKHGILSEELINKLENYKQIREKELN